jgi:hypothetical protein
MMLKRITAWTLAAVLAPALLASSGLAAEGPSVNGFVDFGYNYNFNGLSANTYRAFDAQANSFTLQNAELVVSGKSDADVGYRVDVDWGNDGSVVNAFDGFAPGTTQVNLQQAYLSVPCPLTGGAVTAGKWVTPFGAEVIEAKDNFNTSRGLLFTAAIPLVHTGIKYEKSFADGRLGVLGGVVNGWDVMRDNNKGKSFLAQTSLNLLPNLGIVVGGMHGPEQASGNYTTPGTGSTERFGRSLLDAVVKFTPMEALTLVANYDYGVEEGAPFQATATDDTTANWSGAALHGNYAFTDTWSAALRYENFDDEGSRLTPAAPIHQTVNSITATLQCKRDDVITRLEYRTDSSSDKVFMKDDGTLDDTQSTVGVQWIYSF